MSSDPFTFSHFSPGYRVVLARNAIDKIAEEIAALGCRRPMLLCGGHIARSPIRERVASSLGSLGVAVFDELLPHAKVTAVVRAVAQARQFSPDVLVSLGGGSAVDSAKGVAILLAEGETPEVHGVQVVGGKVAFKELHKPKIPIVAIPTTLSGAELTGGCSLTTEQGVKLLYRDAKLIPKLVILDPVANLAVPPSILAPTGLNALAHCFEGLYSLAREPISTALALAAIPQLVDGLPAMVADPGNVDLRAKLLAGAHLAGRVTVNARTAIHHVICHCLGARTGIDHGIANTIMLPHVLEFNIDAATMVLEQAARALGIVTASGNARDAVVSLIARVRAVTSECRLPARLRDVHVAHADLREVAERAMQEPGIHFDPKLILNAGETLRILEAAW